MFIPRTPDCWSLIAIIIHFTRAAFQDPIRRISRDPNVQFYRFLGVRG
uniref:Uncharacterized protein n=1 Tax=Anguilla anguilla TaxID=7936 RepID=A0A0E9W8G3_ANGAN